MPIPTYQDAMLPVLRALQDTKERHIGEIVNFVIEGFGLTEFERAQMLPSGQSTVIGSRIGWARTYLNKAGLIEKMPGRGIYKITDRGLKVLQRNPERIDNTLLSEFAGFADWVNPKKDEPSKADVRVIDSNQTPSEALQAAFTTITESLSSEALDTIKSLSPLFFERLVIDLLLKMGYGGDRRDVKESLTKKTNDEGIDGVINEDRLGLDTIYVQAKKWEGSVSRPEIQKFAGALQGKRAKKGVFITTSDFTKEAREFASNIENKIILINGSELAKLMIDYNVGVSVIDRYEIKKIDSDYFVEE
ncbi:MAG TPA: restriction endonuclease [Pyrinomonadaceae bacterium]|nr:restriction endonuclease [Pyrinomonadaceae bacterium]